PRKQWMQRLAQVGAALMVLLALLTLSEYLFGWDLGLDRWLFEGKLRAGGQPFPGRIAVGSMLSFFLTGSALWLIDVETKRGWRPAQPLALAAFMIALLVLLCYGYGS